eukprot:jgi/Galph1/1633/GphlegSOOS_G318.1
MESEDPLSSVHLEPFLYEQDNVYEIYLDGSHTLETDKSKESLQQDVGISQAKGASTSHYTQAKTYLESAAYNLSQLAFVLSQLESNQLLELVTTSSGSTRVNTSSAEDAKRLISRQVTYLRLARYLDDRHKLLSSVLERQQEKIMQLIQIRKHCTGIRLATTSLDVQASVAIDDNWFPLNCDDPQHIFIQKRETLETCVACGPGEYRGFVQWMDGNDGFKDKAVERNWEATAMAIRRARFFAFQRRAFQCLLQSAKQCMDIFYYYQNQICLQINPGNNVIFGLVPAAQEAIKRVNKNRWKWDILSSCVCERMLLESFSSKGHKIGFQGKKQIERQGIQKPQVRSPMEDISNSLQSLETLRHLENVSGKLADKYKLKLEWVYGRKLGQVEVRFISSPNDGRGPPVSLGTALLHSSTCVWFTPSFMVHCISALNILNIYSATQWFPVLPEADCPPSFECPVNQLRSVIVLLLCGRLAHSLELAACCGVSIFEVDRQQLALAVRGRRSFTTLWVEVFPLSFSDGNLEKIQLRARLNGQWIYPTESDEAHLLSWFKTLLQQLHEEDKKLFEENLTK